MKIIAIISIAVGLCFGAKTTHKSLNECLYEFHKLSNELNGILYFGYLQNFELGLAEEAKSKINLYPEEEFEFEQYMNRLKSGFDKSNDPEYFLKKARAKSDEMEVKSKECERLKR